MWNKSAKTDASSSPRLACGTKLATNKHGKRLDTPFGKPLPPTRPPTSQALPRHRRRPSQQTPVPTRSPPRAAVSPSNTAILLRHNWPSLKILLRVPARSKLRSSRLHGNLQKVLDMSTLKYHIDFITQKSRISLEEACYGGPLYSKFQIANEPLVLNLNPHKLISSRIGTPKHTHHHHRAKQSF